MRQGHRHRARPRSNVHDARALELPRQFHRFLDQVLGLRAGNQHIAGQLERQPIELAFAGDVLNGFAGQSACNERFILLLLFGG
jgi:hypothetical protein